MATRPNPAELLARVQADDLDGALQAGLMEYRASDDARPALSSAQVQCLLQAQLQLQRAWQARERYRARAVRLARREAERDARRAPAPVRGGPPAALPPAAAAILARAKARAAGRDS
ncbi:hypothetical protein [Stenotrophomonas sp. 24(2023)]|uniref:hypothetical protein n=1 Tax=Stenotrophomonas sp. 24(2023) TaxID=3068324 RepID=UPI0027DF89B1|nr:hypothetical protein [Stenotrophomonas sp. 24(2023)]WMJ68543.1 hypothetical protein Q9R17_15275 [Stenotrophomonas sp. 24(2023)]